MKQKRKYQINNNDKKKQEQKQNKVEHNYR
jgi:hypothetical protein